MSGLDEVTGSEGVGEQRSLWGRSQEWSLTDSLEEPSLSGSELSREWKVDGVEHSTLSTEHLEEIR